MSVDSLLPGKTFPIVFQRNLSLAIEIWEPEVSSVHIFSKSTSSFQPKFSGCLFQSRYNVTTCNLQKFLEEQWLLSFNKRKSQKKDSRFHPPRYPALSFSIITGWISVINVSLDFFNCIKLLGDQIQRLFLTTESWHAVGANISKVNWQVLIIELDCFRNVSLNMFYQSVKQRLSIYRTCFAFNFRGPHPCMGYFIDRKSQYFLKGLISIRNQIGSTPKRRAVLPPSRC